MIFCDITTAYSESSGGIRTYIDEKRRYLLDHTDDEHLLIVPGRKDREQRRGRSTTVHIGSPLLPTQDKYRLFLRPNRITSVLMKYRPELIELGSYYLEPWAAFAYRLRLREEGRNCVIGAYFHTDVARAYVAAPLRAAAHEWFSDWSEMLAEFGLKLADLAVGGAERYIGRIFRQCDLALAASPDQAARLREYGVEHVRIVPLGVDLDAFHPRRRSERTRRRLGARPGALALIFAGRLSTEKHISTLLRAFALLPPELNAVLWLVGEGPLQGMLQEHARANPSVYVIQFLEGRREFARLLASADIYVTAGPYETFALSVIEAQACGLPVVGVDAGALRERVPEALGFLGPVGDAGAMAANIVRAARARTALGARARAHVAQRFSWEQTFDRLLACYREEFGRLAQTRPPLRLQG